MKAFQNNRKQEEKSFLTYFSEAYTEFPKGKIKDSESPDFILSLSNKRKLGIELTRLVQSNSEESEYTIAQTDNLARKICWEARRIFEIGSDLPLRISISFHATLRGTKDEVIDIAGKIAMDILNYCTEIDRKSLYIRKKG